MKVLHRNLLLIALGLVWILLFGNTHALALTGLAPTVGDGICTEPEKSNKYCFQSGDNWSVEIVPEGGEWPIDGHRYRYRADALSTCVNFEWNYAVVELTVCDGMADPFSYISDTGIFSGIYKEYFKKFPEFIASSDADLLKMNLHLNCGSNAPVFFEFVVLPGHCAVPTASHRMGIATSTGGVTISPILTPNCAVVYETDTWDKNGNTVSVTYDPCTGMPVEPDGVKINGLTATKVPSPYFCFKGPDGLISCDDLNGASPCFILEEGSLFTMGPYLWKPSQ